MKIPRLAIIDDGLHLSCIPKNQSVEFFTADRDIIRQGGVSDDDFSHGTICYNVFRSFVKVPYHLISIKVLNSETGTGTKNSLLSALQWCSHQNIDLIHMSMGTRQYLDFAPIIDAVKILTETIIVAACNNYNTITFPACLPNVIGVRHCNVKKLKGKFVYVDAPYDQIELMTYTENVSNSIAAPVISAQVCGYLAHGYTDLEIIRQKLKEDSIQDTSFLSYDFYKNLLIEWETVQVPVIVLPEDTPETIAKLRTLISTFVQDGYRAVALSSTQETNILDYIFHLGWKGKPIALSNIIELYYNFTLPDILFLHIPLRDALDLPKNMQPDIIIGHHDSLNTLYLNINAEDLFTKIKEILS